VGQERDACVLMNIHDAPAESNFCSGGGKAIKPQIVMIITITWAKRNKMANSYSIHWRTIKWMKKRFFHLLDLAILNSYILHSSCTGKKISHTDFRFALVRNMLAHAQSEGRILRPIGRPRNVQAHVTWLTVRGCNY
jgi:hypothetical protein